EVVNVYDRVEHKERACSAVPSETGKRPQNHPYDQRYRALHAHRREIARDGSRTHPQGISDFWHGEAPGAEHVRTRGWGLRGPPEATTIHPSLLRHRNASRLAFTP